MKNYYITTVLLILCGFTFSQNKKEQIATLTIQSDSLKQVILVERGITASKVSGLEQEISNLRKEMVSVQKELTQAKIALLEQEKASINKQLAFDERERNLLDSISFLEKQLRALKLNSYEPVTIGRQVWMTKNLNVDKFRNGDPIPEAKTSEEWEKAGDNGQPAWCYWFYGGSHYVKTEKLYNWYAVNDPRGLAPSEWRIPSYRDWIELTNSLGGEDIAGSKMRSTDDWVPPPHWPGDIYGIHDKEHLYGTNESGFSAVPIDPLDRAYLSENSMGAYWWSSSAADKNNAYFFFFNHGNGFHFSKGGDNKGFGFSVRCLGD